MAYTLIDTSTKADKLVSRLAAEAPALYPFDIETTGLDPHTDDILLIQFQIPSTQEVFILNCRKLTRGEQFSILNALWKDGHGMLLGHNLKFDVSFLLVKFPDLYFYNVRDTFVTEQLITNGLLFKPPSLAELCLKYLNIEMDKKERSSFIGFKGSNFSKEQLEYGARDIENLMKIYKEQSKFINLYNLKFVEEVESRAVPAIAKLETDGIFISFKQWQDNEILARNNQLKVVTRMNEFALQVVPEDIFGLPVINWNSPKQLLELVQKLVNPNIEDTNEKTLEKYSHPFIDALLEYREYNKLITSYGDTVLKQINPKTGRLHPSFNQMGAKTGRMSCKEPNVQQVPKNTVKDAEGKKHAIYREAFKPQLSTGKMVDADYSSFELRVLTDLTKEPEWIKGYTDDLDMHSVVASFIFGVPVSKKTNPELRDIGKSINFGIAYGMGATKLLNSIQSIYRKYNINKTVTIRDAGDILARFFKAFPNIKIWQDQYVAQVMETKKLINPYDGRTLFVEGKDWSNKKIVAAVTNESKNFPCQSTNASVIKIALANLQKFLFENKCHTKVVNVVHDEILLESDTYEEAKMIAPIVKMIMENAASFFIKEVPVKAEPSISDHWTHD